MAPRRLGELYVNLNIIYHTYVWNKNNKTLEPQVLMPLTVLKTNLQANGKQAMPQIRKQVKRDGVYSVFFKGTYYHFYHVCHSLTHSLTHSIHPLTHSLTHNNTNRYPCNNRCNLGRTLSMVRNCKSTGSDDTQESIECVHATTSKCNYRLYCLDRV